MAVDPDKPFNREEMYLAKAAGEGTTVPDEPWSRKEAYLEKISGRIDEAEEDISELDEKVAALATDLSYKGGVADYAHLPNDPAQGDVYTTEDTGVLYVWDGTQWVALNDSPTLVQDTGTSTTDIMSQKATTDMVYTRQSGTSTTNVGVAIVNKGDLAGATNTASRNRYYNSVIIGHTSGSSSVDRDWRCTAIGNMCTPSTGADGSILIGAGCDPYNVSTSPYAAKIMSGTNGHITAIGANSKVYGEYSTAIGASTAIGDYGSNASYAIALGAGAHPTARGEFNVGTAWAGNNKGYNNSNYRLLTGLYDPQSAHDAATKGYVDGKVLQNAGAPTTSTVGTVGQLLEDTTNGKLYQCTAVSGSTYTWSEVGGGGGNDGPIMLFLSEDPDMMEQATMSLYKDAAKTQQVSRQELVNLAQNGGLALLRVYDSGNSWYTSFSVLSVYDDADAIIIDMVGGSPYRHIWTLEFNYNNTATVIDKGNMETTGVEETFTKATGDWSALANSSPYTYSTTVTLTTPVSFYGVVELVNNDIVKFATYGFGILSVSGQVATIASIGQPDSSVTFKIKVKNGF